MVFTIGFSVAFSIIVRSVFSILLLKKNLGIFFFKKKKKFFWGKKLMIRDPCTNITKTDRTFIDTAILNPVVKTVLL